MYNKIAIITSLNTWHTISDLVNYSSLNTVQNIDMNACSGQIFILE